MAALRSYTEDTSSEQRRRNERGSGGADVGPVLAEGPLLSHEGAIYPTLWDTCAPYFLEFVGVFILTTTFIYNYGVNKDPLFTATSNGLMVMSLTYALSHISGANLNPSITMSLLLTGRYTPRVAGRLCLMQILGAVTAAIVRYQFNAVSVDIGPMEGHTLRAVVVIETLYTAMLCFVFLNCAASNKNNPVAAPNGFVGLAVGFCFVAGGYAARQVAHTCMNSAIAVGLGVIDSKHGFSWIGLTYFMADFMGAFIGTAAFRIVRPEEDNVSSALRDPSSDAKKDGDSAKVFAEFIGTFFVIFTKALNRVGSSSSTSTDVGPEAWSVAAALTAMVYSLRGVSGGYFNPAVTLSAVVSGFATCTPRVAIFYVAAQIFAAISASSLIAAMNNGEPIPLIYGQGASVYATAFAEGTFSFLITYVVLTMSAPQQLITPLPASSGGFAIGSISGALLNPAVVLSFTGVDILKGQIDGLVMLYLFYQVFGSLLATGAFFVMHPSLFRESAPPSAAALGEEESKATA